MSKCKKCKEPNCTGGYQGGEEQLWRECMHADTRPLHEKVDWLIAQLESTDNDTPSAPPNLLEVLNYLKDWMAYERKDKTVKIGPGGIPDSES